MKIEEWKVLEKVDIIFITISLQNRRIILAVKSTRILCKMKSACPFIQPNRFVQVFLQNCLIIFFSSFMIWKGCKWWKLTAPIYHWTKNEEILNGKLHFLCNVRWAFVVVIAILFRKKLFCQELSRIKFSWYPISIADPTSDEVLIVKL